MYHNMLQVKGGTVPGMGQNNAGIWMICKKQLKIGGKQLRSEICYWRIYLHQSQGKNIRTMLLWNGKNFFDGMRMS